jgi:hypothetical protein
MQRVPVHPQAEGRRPTTSRGILWGYLQRARLKGMVVDGLSSEESFLVRVRTPSNRAPGT